ncbi:MAG: cupin domain-containing protein [Planctomycetes bacterium]|nr:cupin domain-containing protein [Planctomycetota bacterium]
MPTPTVINLKDKFALFSEQWSPKIIAEMDGFHFKLAKLEGDFVWHSHPDTDEAFMILEGQLRIDFRGGAVMLNRGEMLVVPKGIEHKPFAESECHVMVLVREGTVNTGDSPAHEMTTDPDARI